eukprot:gene4530-biopygen4397
MSAASFPMYRLRRPGQCHTPTARSPPLLATVTSRQLCEGAERCSDKDERELSRDTHYDLATDNLDGEVITLLTPHRHPSVDALPPCGVPQVTLRSAADHTAECRRSHCGVPQITLRSAADHTAECRRSHCGVPQITLRSVANHTAECRRS